jgi:hypothetical protein
LRTKLVVPLVVWELIVLGCVGLVMSLFGKSLNHESVRSLILAALVGLPVVLLCWASCHLIPRAVALVLGSMIGLIIPPLCAWTWVGLQLFPNWMPHFELKVLGIVLSLPSALGGLVVGGLYGRPNRISGLQKTESQIAGDSQPFDIR